MGKEKNDRGGEVADGDQAAYSLGALPEDNGSH